MMWIRNSLLMIFYWVNDMKVKDFIEKLQEFPDDYDIVFPPEDYVNIEIYRNDTFEQVCIEYYPMTKEELFQEIING